MKRRLLKKLLCAALAALMLSGCVSIAFAGYNPAMYDPQGHLTQIYVDGFESKWVYHPDEPGTSLL